MKSPNSNPNILILEDDMDQMLFLIDLTMNEIKSLMDNEQTSEEQRQKLKSIRIIKVGDISSLEKAVSLDKAVLLVMLDCNTPDTKGEPPHDQFVKTNQVITGQHKAVDLVTEHLPGTAITMISSMNRFRTIVNRYYGSKYNLNIDFVAKNNAVKIKENIRSRLQQYLRALN